MKVFMGISFSQSVPVHGQDCWPTCLEVTCIEGNLTQGTHAQ